MRRAMDPVATQQRVLRRLISEGGDASFGREHGLQRVPDRTRI